MSAHNTPYLWRMPKTFPNSAILDHRAVEIKTIKKTDSLTFMHGRKLPFDNGDNPNFAYTKQDPKDYDLDFYSDQEPGKWLKYDCLPNNLGGHPPIVNQRVLHLLQKFCSDDFQFFQVTILSGNPKLPNFANHEYYLLNITHTIDAIDKETSVILNRFEVRHIKKLVLKEDSLKDHHLARIETYHPEIIVSSELVKLFKKEKVKGVRFLKDYEAYPYIPLEERLYYHFQNDKEHGKRYFVSILNNDENYKLLKDNLANIPREVFEELIDMTLSRSSYHAKQCAELQEIMKKTGSVASVDE